MKTILIIDNLERLIEKNLPILSSKKIKLLTASSGEELLQIYRIRDVDLVITDLDIPGMHGDEVTSIIRKDNTLRKGLIIIICDNNKSAIARCQSCGANAYMTKPVNHEELLSKILKFLNIPGRMSNRVLFKGDVTVKFKKNSFYAMYENISNSGMLLVTDELLKPNGKVACSFYIQGDEQIALNGEIVRAMKKTPHQFHYGVKFIQLSTLLKTRLERFVEDKLVG
jgi:CheY-like chemotaxis protein